MYNDEVRNFILNNFNKKNLKNRKFLAAFKDVLVRETGTEGFVTEIIPADLSKEKTSALYNYYYNVVCFDLAAIIRHLKSLKKIGIITEVSDRVIVSEFYQAILHEFAHPYQDLISLDKNNHSPFAKVLRDSILVHAGYFELNCSASLSKKSRIRAYNFYNNYHNLFPGERHADMVSYEMIFSICKELFPSDINLVNGIKYVYSRALKYGYSKDVCPLREFYKLIRHEDVYKSYDFSIYGVHERAIYGAELTSGELHKENMKILRT